MYDTQLESGNPRNRAAAKAARLRSLATLGASVDKLRLVAHHLSRLENEHDAHEMFKLASRIEEAFDMIVVPDIRL